MKIAVIYYSLEGNTKSVAEKIKEKFNADIYELKEIKQKSNKTEFSKYFWHGKQVVMKESPELKLLNLNIEAYDVIFVGTPSWVGTYTPALRTFFKKYNIKNKKIGLFCCHGGGPRKNIRKDGKGTYWE